MTIADRLSGVLKKNKLSANELSKLINVQRSTLSHILSGRNKPSIDLLERFHEAFPEIELGWLVSGKGEMIRSVNNVTAIQENPQSGQDMLDFPEIKSVEPVIDKSEPVLSGQVGTSGSMVTSVTNRKAVRTIIFFNDGTFDLYENSVM